MCGGEAGSPGQTGFIHKTPVRLTAAAEGSLSSESCNTSDDYGTLVCLWAEKHVFFLPALVLNLVQLLLLGGRCEQHSEEVKMIDSASKNDPSTFFS